MPSLNELATIRSLSPALAEIADRLDDRTADMIGCAVRAHLICDVRSVRRETWNCAVCALDAMIWLNGEIGGDDESERLAIARRREDLYAARAFCAGMLMEAVE